MTQATKNGYWHSTGNRRLSDSEREASIMARVEVLPGGCWLWRGFRDANGYGRTMVDGARRPVHRWLYERRRGAVSADMQLDHLCRVRHCVNPEHLEPVTCAENVRRGLNGPLMKTACPKGHPYDDVNTYSGVSRGRAQRKCRACRREYNRERMRRVRSTFISRKVAS